MKVIDRLILESIEDSSHERVGPAIACRRADVMIDLFEGGKTSGCVGRVGQKCERSAGSIECDVDDLVGSLESVVYSKFDAGVRLRDQPGA